MTCTPAQMAEGIIAAKSRSAFTEPQRISDLMPLAESHRDLLAACRMLEAAEEAWANCEDCGGEGVPELCGTCFPAHDDARLARRAAIAKAEGRNV